MKTRLAKSTLLTVAAIAAFLIHPVTAAAPTRLVTQRDFASAVKFAGPGRRLVFVEFMNPACPHCQAFEKAVLTSTAFISYANASLSVVISDLTDKTAMPADLLALVREHSVDGTPTILVFD